MKNAKRLLFASVLFVSLGCSKTGVGGDQMSSTLNSQQKCSEAAKKAGSDPDKLKIEGGGNVAPGDAAHYRLSEDLSCATDKTVEWHTVAGGRSVANTGTSFVSSFSKPGEYVVAAQISTAGSSQTHEVSAKTVVATQVALNGPQVGMAELEHHYELVVPAGVILASAAWNFGDGSPVVNSLAAQDHTFWAVGQYTVTVTVVTNAGETQTISQSIKVLAPTDGMECVRDLTTSGPTEGVVNQPVTMSVYIPPCMTIRMRALSWNFGDGTARDANQTVQHAYTSAGTYNVSLDIFTTASATVPLVTLTRTIEIVAVDVEPEPEPEPQPGQCATLGQTRESNGDIYTEEKECGINGKRTDSYRDRIVETCQQVGTLKKWMETSRSKELLNEGACEGMSCELPAEAMTGVDAILMGIVQVNGKYYLLDGGSKTFYSSQSPAGNCSEVAQLRRCDNGVFSGSSTHKFLLCNNGCEGVGPHGTVQSGVIVGETKVPKACEYGETGIFDTFHTVADKTCDRGTVTTSNTRTGGLKTGGVCPTYGWQPSEAYSACSANCGGVQTRIFECKSPLGETVANSRCAGQAPVETRVCDGNPEAVRRSESATVIEDGSASATCPANQIGEVVRKRESTTTKVYACINHAVALESETVTNGPWVEERYCKDLVAHRCSQDSLGNTDAQKRYQWMLKCSPSSKAISDFLTAFADLQVGSGENAKLMLNGRQVYASFMDGATKKPWIAPIHTSKPCTMPAQAYIATVCLASCATPEQNILAHSPDGRKLNYVPIFKAWDQKFQFVATLGKNASMMSKTVERTAVDQWVTEYMDTEHDIVELRMKSGGSLRLTQNHPLVAADGTMRDAGTFKVGDKVVQLGGKADPIVSAKVVKYYGKVYNVFTKSSEVARNIVITNGYLNGSAFFQNEGADLMNRQLLRGQLIKGAVGK